VKVNYLTLLAGATIMLLTAAARADESAASAFVADANAASPAKTTTASTAPAAATSEDTATYYDDSDPVQDFIVRAGGWYVHQTGNPAKVDEYQGRNSSVFWNTDGIFSNGERTVDFSAYQSDNDDAFGRVHYYGGPRLEADVLWQQFPHELDTKTYAGWLSSIHDVSTSASTGPNANWYEHDNIGNAQEYAIHVQEFKANFKGDITENLRWKVNVFGIDKEGYRQANDFTHCFNAAASPITNSVSGTPIQYSNGAPSAGVTRACHAVSQAQHIDWQTTEMDAGLELKLNCDTTLAYSHLVRAFTANDQQVYSAYRFSANPGNSGQLGFGVYTPTGGVTTGAGAYGMAGYNIVPDSQTQIDRLKFATKIGCDTDAYLLGYVGYNEDQLRGTYRNFNGTDLRITNHSLEHCDVTAYGKYYREESTSPLVPLNTLYSTPAQQQFYQENNLNWVADPQINREVHGAGLNGRWRPFENECDSLRRNLSFTAGYDYNELLRENAGDTLLAGGSGVFVNNGTFTQPDTVANTFSLGVEERWSKSLDTQLRYKYISTQYPLYGITPDAGQSIDAALNSNLPTQENRIELQSTWTPTDKLMLNATFYVENAMSDARYVGSSALPGWTSNSLPFTLSAWWAPTCDWSFNVGFSEMDSWINQGISAGPLNNTGDGINVPWAFQGTSDVFTLGTRYAATSKLSFMGQFEYVHGINASFATVPSSAQTPTTGAAYDLGQYSLVKEQSFRFETGVDYLITRRITTYLRYDYYDFQDLSTGYLSGQQNMILGGMSATF
jgi:hypothetical protein